MFEGLLTELEALTKLSIVPAFAASGMASWLIFKHRAQLREFMMSRRRIRAKKEAEWSLIANEFALKLHQLKTEGKVHDWAYTTLTRKMRSFGMDVSMEPTYADKPKHYTFTNPFRGLKLQNKLLRLKLAILNRKQKKEAPPKKVNTLEAEFEHCRKS